MGIATSRSEDSDMPIDDDGNHCDLNDNCKVHAEWQGIGLTDSLNSNFECVVSSSKLHIHQEREIERDTEVKD